MFIWCDSSTSYKLLSDIVPILWYNAYCMTPSLPEDWKKILHSEISKTYFTELCHAVERLYCKQGNSIYPPQSLLFHAFSLCTFENVKVVILGQDPYYKKGQAHGLAFSVPEGVPIPPSLSNIYKEIYTATDHPINRMIGCDTPESGNLERWAKQGVLLLNSVLTVEEDKPGSHSSLGWERFTDAVIQKISDEKEHVVFLLWGVYAQTKEKHINTGQHLVLTSSHPSPLSAYRGFFGCDHFNKTNQYLKKHHIQTIDW